MQMQNLPAACVPDDDSAIRMIGVHEKPPAVRIKRQVPKGGDREGLAIAPRHGSDDLSTGDLYEAHFVDRPRANNRRQCAVRAEGNSWGKVGRFAEVPIE